MLLPLHWPSDESGSSSEYRLQLLEADRRSSYQGRVARPTMAWVAPVLCTRCRLYPRYRARCGPPVQFRRGSWSKIPGQPSGCRQPIFRTGRKGLPEGGPYAARSLGYDCRLASQRRHDNCLPAGSCLDLNRQRSDRHHHRQSYPPAEKAGRMRRTPDRPSLVPAEEVATQWLNVPPRCL